ncbi:MAG: ATP synthase F1 subunit gamma [Deltaproteobacteria bacterium]|jgi:F-type H+-transporting ATPase subunit gamma|nr:ATP synthase F1 subunit gamma [Deltaproteobacteria bacterium]
MQSLKDLRRRILATRDTLKIVRSMKLIAAAKLRGAQAAATKGRPYALELHRSVQRISGRLGADAPEMWRRPDHIGCLDTLVITSDRGMCGGFNENLLRFVEWGCYEHETHNIPVKLYVIGRKGRQFLKTSGYDVERVPSEGGTEKAVRWVVNNMMLRFLSGESSGGFVVFNKYLSSTKYEVTSWNLLPLYTRNWGRGDDVEYIFEPERDLALDFFASEFLMETVRQAIVESYAAEQVARIMAMSSATKNADDMIAHLTSLYNKARQEAITSELMDIVGGAEALGKCS